MGCKKVPWGVIAGGLTGYQPPIFSSARVFLECLYMCHKSGKISFGIHMGCNSGHRMGFSGCLGAECPRCGPADVISRILHQQPYSPVGSKIMIKMGCKHPWWAPGLFAPHHYLPIIRSPSFPPRLSLPIICSQPITRHVYIIT